MGRVVLGRVLCGASCLGASCLWGELSVIRTCMGYTDSRFDMQERGFRLSPRNITLQIYDKIEKYSN